MAQIERAWRFLSPITYHSTAMYYGLPPDKQTGVLIAGAALWLAFGGRAIFRNGKLVTFLPSCKFEYYLRSHKALVIFVTIGRQTDTCANIVAYKQSLMSLHNTHAFTLIGQWMLCAIFSPVDPNGMKVTHQHQSKLSGCRAIWLTWTR